MRCTEFEFNDIAYVKVDIIALQEIYIEPYAKKLQKLLYFYFNRFYYLETNYHHDEQ